MDGIFKTDNIELKKIMIEEEIKTTKELAEKSGINRNTLAGILNGKIQPSADAMQRLVATLKIEPEKAGNIFFNMNLRNT